MAVININISATAINAAIAAETAARIAGDATSVSTASSDATTKANAAQAAAIAAAASDATTKANAAQAAAIAASDPSGSAAAAQAAAISAAATDATTKANAAQSAAISAAATDATTKANAAQAAAISSAATDATTKANAAQAASQPLDADLTAIAALTSAADKIIQFTGSGTAALIDLKLGPGTAYTGADSYTAGVQPSGASSKTQYFRRTGNEVRWKIIITWANAATTCSNAVFTMPAEFPVPVTPPGFTGAGARVENVDIVRLLAAPNGAMVNATGYMIIRNAGDTAYEFASTAAFAPSTVRCFVLSGSYFTS